MVIIIIIQEEFKSRCLSLQDIDKKNIIEIEKLKNENSSILTKNEEVSRSLQADLHNLRRELQENRNKMKVVLESKGKLEMEVIMIIIIIVIIRLIFILIIIVIIMIFVITVIIRQLYFAMNNNNNISK